MVFILIFTGTLMVRRTVLMRMFRSPYWCHRDRRTSTLPDLTLKESSNYIVAGLATLGVPASVQVSK